jgi:hypothetical protein
MPHKNPLTTTKLSKSGMAPAKKPPARSLLSSTKARHTKSPVIPSYMVVDSLLPFHIFSDRKMFQNYVPGRQTHTTPHSNIIVVEGTGTVVVHIAAHGSSFTLSLDGCWHVPDSPNNFFACLRTISKGSQVMLAPRSPRLLVAHKSRILKPKLPKYFLLSKHRTHGYLILNFTSVVPDISPHPLQTQNQISLLTIPQPVAFTAFTFEPSSPSFSINKSPPPSPPLPTSLPPPLIPTPLSINSPNSPDSISPSPPLIPPFNSPNSSFLTISQSSHDPPPLKIPLSHSSLSHSSPLFTLESNFSDTSLNLVLSDSHLPFSSPILFNPWLYFSPFPP